MINNRQGGRRRGRGGQRPQNIGQPGNRQDNRQRGNAAQLLEKYKNMARDAQLAGDRVQSEYYLQFAEHYHRMLGESRARFDEQRRQRGEDGDDENDDDGAYDAIDDQPQQQQQQPRESREPRAEREPREPREAREPRERRPRRSERSNGQQPENDDEGGERIAFDVLPPAIGADGGDDDDGAPTAEVIEAKPRRRTPRPRATDEGDIAPAA
ncbi:DUF4167 domain-containing protein [Sphingomonas sinipercae]|uniref:DUF4167 domain-containing protein n=1 Tax=Sphingomonas sinipercae TaxID=2714944 RepID=A0A6G7ZKG1_9SPHN|nr:DUF4167 domain-containing protein [Sphingomonas sinipercae]QIL01405.1 DUF4167 domain-containing protein [Sphingomonas sinipercae]